MQKKIDAMSNHIIICGFGRNGKQAARKLLAYNKPYVVIERNKEIIEKYREENIPFVFLLLHLLISVLTIVQNESSFIVL